MSKPKELNIDLSNGIVGNEVEKCSNCVLHNILGICTHPNGFGSIENEDVIDENCPLLDGPFIIYVKRMRT